MHKSVLLNEVINGLDIKDNNIVVDMTVGNGGHLAGIIRQNFKNLILVGMDADQNAINNSKNNLDNACSEMKNKHKLILERNYFDFIDDVLEANQIDRVNAFIFDLGFRSDQVDDPKRGFSFLKEGPLNMSFSTDESQKDFFLNADLIVNTWSEETLADIIYGFGEEKFARRIAKSIVEYRKQKKIETTTELSEIIKNSVPFFYRKLKIHPATKTFQAIRIAVNSELDRLKKALQISFDYLTEGGRIAVISFHSLEDRIVKNFFRDMVIQKRAQLINKKPITASNEELLENPRSRSAKLRIIKKIN